MSIFLKHEFDKNNMTVTLHNLMFGSGSAVVVLQIGTTLCSHQQQWAAESKEYLIN